ncbi:hypothetical protein KCU81_g40, partial [Aureobasidium melanogenum]
MTSRIEQSRAHWRSHHRLGPTKLIHRLPLHPSSTILHLSSLHTFLNPIQIQQDEGQFSHGSRFLSRSSS